MSGMEGRRRKAYHEAGHAVAARRLQVPFKRVWVEGGAMSTPEAEAPAGFVIGGQVVTRPLTERQLDALALAGQEAGRGGFINARTRRWVEKEIMVTLAGAETAAVLLGSSAEEEGGGVLVLTEDARAEWEQGSTGRAAPRSLAVPGGDDAQALYLASCVSGGEEEEPGAYVEWLRQRTLSLIRAPGFLPAVKALAAALMERGSLSHRDALGVIEEAHRPPGV